MILQSVLLSPARRLMNRLTYPRKFALVSVFFILPLAVVLYFLLAEIKVRTTFTHQQIHGLKGLNSLRALQHEVGEGFFLAAVYSGGSPSARPNLIGQQGKIDTALARLQSVYSQLDTLQKNAVTTAVLVENQRFMRTAVFGQDTAVATSLHQQLLADIAALAAEVGDSSNLIIDPVLDSFYLIDTLLLRVLPSADLMFDLRLLVNTIAIRGQARPDELAALASLTGRLQAESKKILAGLKIAYDNTDSLDLKTQLDGAALQYDRVVARAVADIGERINTTPDFKLVRVQLDNAIKEAASANLAFGDVASVQLEKLLLARIDRDERQRFWTLVFSALSLLLVAYLLAGFYASVMGIVQRLRQASERMNSGDFTDTVTLQTHDELGQVAASFNTVALRLREETRQADEESKRARLAEAEVREHEAELVASREEALDAARAKAAFLATMSHEIRTPLNGVVGMSTLLAETQLDAEQRDYLQTIRLSSDQLLSVINDILDFSKIESGKLELESEPLGLRSAIEEACDIAAPRAREKGLELIIDLPEPRAGGLPVAILGDITRLRQVLINLINNSVKFTEKGEVAIHVRLLESDDGQGRSVIEFRVTDTGIGIPADRVGQLFQAFAQVDASTTRKYGGTGLGLVICKRLVELMGGQIGVESVLGQGSTFWFTVVAPAAHIAPSYSPAEIGALRGKRVLIVDDNATNIRILQRQLQLWGMEVATSESGAQALATLQEPTLLPEVIITDMHMPEMDGVTLAKLLKAHLTAAKIPIILLSSGFMPAGEATTKLFDTRLLKPARQNQLFETIARCLAPDSLIKKVEAVRVDQAKDVTILVADDNAVNLKVAGAILRKLGYRVVTANDGNEAVAAIAGAMQGHVADATLPFGAILMDLNMPHLDGLQATRQIQATWGTLSPPIIAVTAAASDDDRSLCLNAGMNDYLTKPLQVAALAQTLEKWVVFPTTELPAAAQPAALAQMPTPTPALSTLDTNLPARLDIASLTVFDSARLQGFLEFDDPERSLTREVIRLFVDALPGHVQAISTACAAGDTAALYQAAHGLKGSASNVGASALQAVCSVIEETANAGELTTAQHYAPFLDGLANQTMGELEEFSRTEAAAS